nr:Rv2231c family pyridoxal phosphate-dependent protein CobC [Epidermidibacterium keratini]
MSDRAERAMPDPDLRHHGDAELGEGLVDFAVNVRRTAPPTWLVDRLRGRLDDLAAYPNPSVARRKIALAHGISAECALPTSGGAEAFTLVARGVAARHPVVVHPQFTEPEHALRVAGYDVDRVVLSADSGFALDPRSVPESADLVIVGNPTNPTGVLHRAQTLRELSRPGRTLVVDEAFMDALPDEAESLAYGESSGIVVIRSLTKTWGIAGLRAGYVVGDREIIARLEAVQPHWSVSALALEAIDACLDDTARAAAAADAVTIIDDRRFLADSLQRRGLRVVESHAPFVLVDTFSQVHSEDPLYVWNALRLRGYAVRRCDTFPGLGGRWVRVAVRDRETVEGLLRAWDAVTGG